MGVPLLQLRAIQKRFPGVHALARRRPRRARGRGRRAARRERRRQVHADEDRRRDRAARRRRGADRRRAGRRARRRTARPRSGSRSSTRSSTCSTISTSPATSCSAASRRGWGALRLDRSREDARRPCSRTSTQLGLGRRRRTRRLAALSIAQQQLVEIAKALSLNARAAHHGRADVEPDARRDGAGCTRSSPVSARAGRRRSSTSRTGSAKCGPSPIARSCCATARTPARWRATS